MAIDVDRLPAEAMKKHGVRLDPNDPAVVLVTLNRLVLEDAAKAVTADIRKATGEFEQAATRLQSRLKPGPSFGAGSAMSARACG
jgi:hypothetical protein